MNKSLCIAEWQSFGVDEIKGAMGCHDSANVESCNDEKAQTIFDELKDFAHQEGNHCFLKFKNSKTLVAQNYVGLIQTKSGFCVEILPKTFRTANETQGFEVQQKDERIDSAKELLCEMLKTLKDSPFKRSHFANLRAQNMSLLEIFIAMFLNELDNLVKKGLKSSYVTQEENRKFLKGKLLFNQNLKHNLTHKERFFTTSDEFSTNIAPNRIIKSTLELLSRQTFSSKIYARLTQMRFIFADIASSQNIDKDLSQCANSRLFDAYDLVLQWCKIFLKKQTFTPYQGSNKAFALLFDMNTLFESLVASELRKSEVRERVLKKIGDDDIRIESQPQENSKFLAQEKESRQNRFRLKPDIVGYENVDNDSKPAFIADTKWKILSDGSNKNYAISQNDMYQMWAYLSKYKCEKGFLIYPEITKNNKEPHSFKSKFPDREFAFTFKTDFQTKLTICFFPLFINSKH